MRHILHFDDYLRRFLVPDRLPVLSFALAALSLVCGCRNEPSNQIDPPLSAPFIYSFQLGVPSIDLDTSSAPAVRELANKTYQIEDSLSVIVLDPIDGSNVGSCTYSVTSPGSSAPFMTGTLARTQASGNSAYFAAKIDFTITRAEVGPYVIEVDAADQSAYVANAQRATLLVIRNNSRPIVSNLLAPDTLIRPQNGFKIVRFAISAFDSDGLGDIAKVFFRAVNSSEPNREYQMFDDGNLAADGDSVANDGRFACLLTLDSTATLGRQEFLFFARDNSNAVSDSLVHYIVIK